MRRTVLTVTAFAATLMTGSMLSPATASPIGNAAALTGAAEDIAVVDSVHCRPGWRHHEPSRYRRSDGCGRRGGVVVLPGRQRYVIRDGVRVRIGSDRDRDFRSRTTIRTGEERGTRTTIRSREERSGRTTIRSGEERGGRATVRSGGQAETTGRGMRSGEGREGRSMRSGEGGMSKGGTGQGGRRGGGGQEPGQQQQQRPQ
jgi:hypothetical protein